MPETITVPLELQAAYDEQYTAELSAWRELGAQYKAENIQALCQGLQVRSALECGAGEGSILLHLDAARFCPELHALEISPSGLRAIRQRTIASVKSVMQFNGYNLPYQNKSFDLAILSHVLEHVEHPRLLLRELKRVSRYTVIEVPLDYSPWVDERLEHYLAYGHINIFTPALLRFLLKSEGFSVLRDRYDAGHGAVQRFQMYRNQRLPQTLRSELMRRGRNTLIALRRQLTPPAQRRELRYNAYCVLCEDSGSSARVF
jgi:ubiquinone/menaquinone biosynthesis C-methylase UbiE